MTENPELKSVSDDTVTVAKKPLIEALALPYRGIVYLDRAEVEKEIEQFWKDNGDEVIKRSGYKGKKREGGKIDHAKARVALENSLGIDALYKSLLGNMAAAEVDKNSDNKILFVGNVFIKNYKELDKDLYVVVVFYYWPELHYEGEVDFSVVATPMPGVEEEFNRRVEDLRIKHKKKNICEISAIGDNTCLLLDIISSIDAVSYDKCTIRNTWREVRHIESPVLQEALKAHKKGDLFEIEYPSVWNDEHKGKTVKSIVKILETAEIVYYSLDDVELYKLEHFDSKEAFREKFVKDYETYVLNAKKRQAVGTIMERVLTLGHCDPVPQAWLDMNAGNMVDQHVAACGGSEEKAFAAAGVKDKEGLYSIFLRHILDDFLRQVAVRWYAKRFGVEVTAVADDIVSRAIWA